MGFPAVTQPDEAPRAEVRTHDPVLISGREWWWLVAASAVLVLIGLAPLLLSASATAQSDWSFMGVAHNYLDGATYLSKMRIGWDGDWLLQLMHTPEPHEGALMVVVYMLLGHVARISGLDLVTVYHLGRAVAAFAMYLSLYTLAAALWASVGARRLFFAFAAFGFGFGWLLSPLTGRFDFPDLGIPEMFPFYSSLVNVHFPLAIGILALLMTQLVLLIRPGGRMLPRGSWLVTALLSLALALLYPQALPPFAAAAFGYLALVWWHERRLPNGAWAYAVALIAPAAPLAVYLALEVTFNPAFAEWNRQNVTPSPPLWVFLAGMGLPLLLGLPAIWRAARRMDRDGDRLMLFWLLAMLVFVFLPTSIQRRFAVGMMIPVAFFAVRAVRQFWMPKLGKRIGSLLVAASIVLMTVSGLLVLVAAPAPLLAGDGAQRLGFVLPRDYRAALDWLNTHATSNDVVLASENVGAWIPAWSGSRVVYGHPFETLEAEDKLAAVEAWYALPDGDTCRELLDRYRVRYVVAGPLEAEYGTMGCLTDLRMVMQNGSVSVYAVP